MHHDLAAIILVAWVAYFLPTLVAFWRGHHNAPAILALNLLAGWTLVGWIAAAVWSCTAIRRTGDG